MTNRNDRPRPWRLICPAALLLTASGAWAQCTPDTIFGAPTSFATGSLPSNVTTGDVNGDGFMDIVTGNFFGGSVSILFGDGTGALGGHVELPLIVDPNSLFGAGANEPAIGDLNGDGLADIVVGVTSPDLGNPGVAVFLQQAGGSFADPTFHGFSTQIRGVRLAHMNADAFLDVVYANRDDDTLNVLRGNGNGTFQPELFNFFSDGPVGAVIADFNNDGSLDIAAPLVFSSEVVIAVNDGAGNLTELARYPVTTSPENLAGGDFNGDGVLDLVTGSAATSVEFLLGNADGTFQAAQTINTGADSLPLGVRAADLDGDGFDDIVATHFIAGGVNVFLSNGDGTFDGTTSPLPGESRGRSVAFADFDGNGAVDVVVSGNAASILLNQCAGSAPVCSCETDGNDAQVDVFDLLAYLDLWFGGDAAAELTGDDPASVDVFDLLAFLDCWFPASAGAPCP